MAETTKIEWADATLSLWWGCTKVSPACANCYAETWARRWGKRLWGPGAPRERKAGAEALARKLNRQAEREGRRLRVFSASMSDWLDPEVPAEWLADLLALVEATPALDWLLLSKRPELWRERIGDAADARTAIDAPGAVLAEQWLAGDQPANVWLGCTVEDQEHADERIPELLKIPARVRFLSCEPLLSGVDLSLWIGGLIHWIIAGGESGRGARPSHPDWFRSLRDQAVAAGVPFHFKQWGEFAPEGLPSQRWIVGLDGRAEPDPLPQGIARRPREGTKVVYRVGKAAAGRLLDGRTWDEVPHAP